MLKSINILFVSAFVSASAYAQTANIEGKVATSDGQPASDVRVILKNSAKGAISDSLGHYNITKVKAGHYTLVASFLGQKEFKKEIDIKEGQTLHTDVVLAQDARTMNEVMITGYKSYNRQNTDLGKMSVKMMDLPQAAAVIGREVIEQQSSLHLSDILKNTNGVYQMGSTGGYQEEVAGRGFAFSSSNTFKNGIRFNNGIMPEISSLEKLEILKGSSAILFGNVAAGGVLNLVTKKPKFEKGGEVSMRVGSYDFYKPSVDIYGAVNNSKKLAYRVNTSYEKSGSYRQQVQGERFYINPSLLYKANDKLTILIEGDYLKDSRTVDYGTGAVNYVIANVPRNRFLGAAWSNIKSEQMSADMVTTYKLGKNWELKNIIGVQNFRNDLFSTTRPNASGNFVAADGKWIRGVQRTKIYDQYYMTEVDLSGKFYTGPVKHEVLVGGDIDKYVTRTTAFSALSKYDSINIYNPSLYQQRTDIPSLKENTLTKAPLYRSGIYVQDLISVTKYLKVLAGARYSYQHTQSDVYTYSKATTATTLNFDDAVTPRFGLVYQPMKTMSVFASYANSFVLNTGLDINGKALPPSFVDQYEAGVKNELLNGLLTANATVYSIVNHNLSQSVLDSTNPNAKELAGEVTSKGAEVDIMSKSYRGFSVIAGYSYNQTKYTKSNTYVVGSLLRYNPAHTANLSLYYTFGKNTMLKGFNLGATVLYIGDRVAGRSTRRLISGKEVANDSYKLMPVPAYTQCDASIGYEYNNLSVRIRITNIFNVLSYNVHDDNSVNPIAPRLFAGTVTYKF